MPTCPVAGTLYASSKAESPNHLTLTTSVGPSDETPRTRAPAVRLSISAIPSFLSRVASIILLIAVDNQLNIKYPVDEVAAWISQSVYVHCASRPN